MFDSILETLRNLGVNWPHVIMQALNFGIVVTIIYFAAIRGILRTMDERKDKIESGLKYAEEMKQKLAEAEEKQAEIVREARQSAQEIVAEARKAAKDYQDQQSAETAAKVEQKLARGKESIELERKKVFEELKGEVSRLVVLTTSKVLMRDLAEGEKSSINSHAAEELARNN